VVIVIRTPLLLSQNAVGYEARLDWLDSC